MASSFWGTEHLAVTWLCGIPPNYLMQLQENQCNDFVSNLVSFYVLFTQFTRDKLKILKMQHINYIVKIRKREANLNLRNNGAVVSVGHSLRTVEGSDYTRWQHILFLKQLWTNTSSPQPSLPTQKVLVILLPSYFTVSKTSKNIIENTCY